MSYVIYGAILIFGILLILLSSDSKPNIENYRSCEIEALKAEHKGQIEAAIDYYIEAIFHVKHDNNLSGTNYNSQQILIQQFEAKIAVLKASVESQKMGESKTSNPPLVVED